MSMEKVPSEFILTGITSDNVHAVYRALLKIDPKSKKLRSFVGRDPDHFVYKSDPDHLTFVGRAPDHFVNKNKCHTSWNFKNGEWAGWCNSEHFDRYPSAYGNHVRISVNDLFKGKLPEPPKQPLLSDVLPL